MNIGNDAERHMRAEFPKASIVTAIEVYIALIEAIRIEVIVEYDTVNNSLGRIGRSEQEGSALARTTTALSQLEYQVFP